MTCPLKGRLGIQAHCHWPPHWTPPISLKMKVMVAAVKAWTVFVMKATMPMKVILWTVPIRKVMPLIIVRHTALMKAMPLTDASGRLSEPTQEQEASEVPPIHHTALEPLRYSRCTCTAISVFESHLTIYHFYLKYGLSTTASQELQLLELHLPGAKVPHESVCFNFIPLFPDLESSVHHYCSVCHRPVDASSSCSQASRTKESFICVP